MFFEGSARGVVFGPRDVAGAVRVFEFDNFVTCTGFALPDFVKRADLVVAGAVTPAADLEGVAFRTGAFSAKARLTICLERTDESTALRPLAGDFGETFCEAGRLECLFAPLMTASLMRSTQLSEVASVQTEAKMRC
jgi:hypothetical protein